MHVERFALKPITENTQWQDPEEMLEIIIRDIK